MNNLYVEFGIELFDKTLTQSVISIMKNLGDLKISDTKRNSTIIDYCIHSKTDYDLENISNELCEKFEPYKETIKKYLSTNSSKLYSDICFVKISDNSDVSIKINKRLIRLAYELNVEINFDGF